MNNCSNFAPMMEINITDNELRTAASEGMDAFIGVFTSAIKKAIGGELNADNMGELNADQITLLAYETMRDEVMDGGFIQLIHNGYGGFIFLNPFAKALKLWGLRDLSKIVYHVHSLYMKCHDELEKDCTDDDFMALYEQYPEFDDYDDDFVENEEEWTGQVARYVDEHIEQFANITK